MRNRLLALTPNVLEQENLSNHTTLKIGGPCDYLIIPDTVEELINVVSFAKEQGIRLTVLGNGSNVLVDDSGIDGIVLKTTNLKTITVEGNTITAGTGARLSTLCETALQNGLNGLCELSGVPGTVGGGVYMNAGAYGGEIKDTLTTTRYLSETFEVKTLTNEEHEFSYRKSVFQKHPEWIILESTFTLTPGNREEMKKKTVELLKKRNDAQPLEYPNAGSTFKRPEGYFAGKLIDDCKLRGCQIGGAQVSEKHCGFLVNKGGAASNDVVKLVQHIRNTVEDAFGVTLEAEIRYYKRGEDSVRL